MDIGPQQIGKFLILTGIVIITDETRKCLLHPNETKK